MKKHLIIVPFPYFFQNWCSLRCTPRCTLHIEVHNQVQNLVHKQVHIQVHTQVHNQLHIQAQTQVHSKMRISHFLASKITRQWIEKELAVSRQGMNYLTISFMLFGTFATEILRSHIISEIPLYLLTPSCRFYTARYEDSDLGDPWWAIFWPGGQVRFPSC